MKGSLQRVRKLLAGEKPDRPPLFDLFTNDAVLAHFNGGRPVAPEDDRAGTAALARAVDGSRWSYFSPNRERIEYLPDGRQRRFERWTIWTAHLPYASSEEYAAAKRRLMRDRQGQRQVQEGAGEALDFSKDQGYQKHRQLRREFGDDLCFLLYGPSVGLMGLYEEVGLEQFGYFLSDCEEVMVEQLERNTEWACRWARDLPADDPFEAVFLGEDIAFKTGPMVSPAWLDRHFFPRLKRIVDALHAREKKVVYHSDGNLNLVMDSLVAAGIDGLNPIEVAAGMDLADLHRRYPRLLFFGGIDVSSLLPFGTPGEVRDAVVKAIDDTEGLILVGSSTEVTNAVPLANYLALRETTMNYRLG